MEILAVLCILVALAIAVLSGHLVRLRLRTERAVRSANQAYIEQRLELYHGHYGAYPTALAQLKRSQLLDEIPVNPGGRWGYDGNGNVWPVQFRSDEAGHHSGPRPGDSSPPGTDSLPGILGGILLQWLLPLARLVDFVRMRFGRSWGTGNRLVWLDIIQRQVKTIRSLQALIRTTRPLLGRSRALLAAITAHLIASMARQRIEHRIPLRADLGEQEKAAQLFDRIRRDWEKGERTTAAAGNGSGRRLALLGLVNAVAGGAAVTWSALVQCPGSAISLAWGFVALAGVFAALSGTRR
jgi:hypothetical protein